MLGQVRGQRGYGDSHHLRGSVFAYDADTNALTRGVLGYMVDASSRLSKHALSYDRLGRATDHTFGSDDAGNRRRMHWQYSYDDSNAGRLTAIASSNDDDLSSGETTSQYYQYDHRGNVVAMTDSSGDIRYGYQYDAFGNITFSFDEGAAAGPTDGILFTGKDLDPDTGLYYFNARWYDGNSGRFLTQSQVSPYDEKPYGYCQANPIAFADPDGRLFFAVAYAAWAIWVISDKVGQLLCAKRVGQAYWDAYANSIHHQDPHDSFVHCVTSCEIASQCGQGVSVVAGRVQEWGNEWETHRDTQDDEVANAYGRACAEDERGCDCCCEEGYYNEDGTFRH